MINSQVSAFAHRDPSDFADSFLSSFAMPYLRVLTPVVQSCGCEGLFACAI